MSSCAGNVVKSNPCGRQHEEQAMVDDSGEKEEEVVGCLQDGMFWDEV